MLTANRIMIILFLSVAAYAEDQKPEKPPAPPADMSSEPSQLDVIVDKAKPKKESESKQQSEKKAESITELKAKIEKTETETAALKQALDQALENDHVSSGRKGLRSANADAAKISQLAFEAWKKSNDDLEALKAQLQELEKSKRKK